MLEFKLTVAYARYSVEDIKKDRINSNSITNQLQLIKTFSNNLNITIDKEFIDDGYSGANFERPGFNELIGEIEKDIIGTVIVKDLSRLGRNFYETVYYINEYFIKHNVRFIAINDNFDSYNEDDYSKNILVQIKSIMNDFYVKDVSVKRRQVATSHTEEGQFIGFKPPYGYRIVKHGDFRTLEIDEYASEVVKRIFTEIDCGKSRKQVAKELNDEKIAPPVIYLNLTPSMGKKYYYEWTDKIVYRILKNETYIGRIVVRKSQKRDYHKKKRDYIKICDRQTIDNCHPAIISDSLFRSANSKLKICKNRYGSKDYSGSFKGLMRCGECGHDMSVIKRIRENNSIQYYFKCHKSLDRKICSNRSIADNKLKRIVTDCLKSLIEDFVNEEKVVYECNKRIIKQKRLTEKINQLKYDIELHNKNIREFYIKKTNNEITLEEFLEKKVMETTLRETSSKKLNELLNQQNSKIRKEELVNMYSEFIDDRENSNKLIRELIEKIVIYNDNTIHISFKFEISKPKKIKFF